MRSLLGEQKATPCFHSSKRCGVDSELPAAAMQQWVSQAIARPGHRTIRIGCLGKE